MDEVVQSVIVEKNQVLAKCNVCYKKFGQYKPICPKCREEYKKNKAKLKKMQVEPEAKQQTLLEGGKK